MRHPDQSRHCTLVRRWALLTAAAVVVLPGGPIALGENGLAPEPGQSEVRRPVGRLRNAIPVCRLDR